MYLLLSLALHTGHFACVYRVNTTIWVTSYSKASNMYYGYDSKGETWRVSPLAIKPGKCHKITEK